MYLLFIIFHILRENINNFFLIQNMAAQLFAMDSFPVPLKTKAIYFVKINKVVVPKDNPSSVLIIGDMASKPIEQLATIVDDVSIYI